MKVSRALSLGTIVAALCAGSALAAPPTGTIHVKGTGTDLLSGAIMHSKQKTATGLIQQSTEIIELNGDLHGKVLYDVTSVINERAGTLVNSGDQVFSGTIAGSAPVMIHDPQFRFYANLKTGAEHGSVYLTEHIAGPLVQCELEVTGTGRRSDGNPTFKYVGACTFAQRARPTR